MIITIKRNTKMIITIKRNTKMITTTMMKTTKIVTAVKTILRAFKSIQPTAIQTHTAEALPVETGPVWLYRYALYRYKCP